MDPLDLRLANHADVDPVHGKPWSSALLVAGPVYGSSATMGTGGAVLLAAREVKAKLARLAHVKDASGLDVTAAMKRLGIAELAADGRFALPNDAASDAHGASSPTPCARAEPSSSRWGLTPTWARSGCAAPGSYSAGRIINPKTARSPMIGGIVWG